MSSQQSRPAVENEPGEDEVAEFLELNQDFFERHPETLARMRLPHDSGGGTVSLVERQLAVLREQSSKLERKLRELVGLARQNDRLADKVHQLALRLIGTGDSRAVLDTLEASLREDFGASDSVVILFHSPSDIMQQEDTRFLRHLARNDPTLKPFATLLERARPRCGRARDTQIEVLFPQHAVEIGSVALIPLGRRSEFGLLAIGSRDTGRFHPGMSTDFLQRIGEMVSRALAVRAA